MTQNPNSKSKDQHILAYVQSSKITDWKRLMNPHGGIDFPFLYGSNDKNVFARKVKRGAALWIIGASPDNRPPSLVARLNVIGRAETSDEYTSGIPKAVLRTFRKNFDFIAVGDPKESQFYGHNNASRALLSLMFRWVKTERTLSGQLPCPGGTCKWDSSFATPLNSPAVVVGNPKPLYDLHKSSHRCVFISWKRRDNWKRRASVRKLAYALADEGLSVWLDILAIPSSIALKTKVDPDAELLESLLRYGYHSSNGLLALETLNFGKEGISGNWTEKEWIGDLEAGKQPKPIPFRAVYRFESSESSAKLVQKNDCLLTDINWQKTAKILRDEMVSRFPIPD